MKTDMHKWLEEIFKSQKKKSLPILSYPACSLTGFNVRQLVTDSDLQAKAIIAVAEHCDSYAAVSLMDLSVEAEAFGAEAEFFDNEIPVITGSYIKTSEDIHTLIVPSVGSGRTKIYIEAVKKASERITDKPLLAGIIGPFSLASRLMGVSELILFCYDEPEEAASLLDKCVCFLTDYANALKEAGANGIIMAEPLTGMLSPSMAEEFSTPYVKKITSAVNDKGFITIYHNCGNNTVLQAETIAETGADAFHFGNAIDIFQILAKMPANKPIMGNIDPASLFLNGTPEQMKKEVSELLEKCSPYQNFIISSGCDIPPAAPWDNIDAFFSAVEEYYSDK